MSPAAGSPGGNYPKASPLARELRWMADRLAEVLRLTTVAGPTAVKQRAALVSKLLRWQGVMAQDAASTVWLRKLSGLGEAPANVLQGWIGELHSSASQEEQRFSRKRGQSWKLACCRPV